MTVLESWELNTVTLTISVPELTFLLENVIIFSVWLIDKLSEMVFVETWPRYPLIGIE